MNTIGLVVNPIAGMGGAVGLKGTDGLVAEAVRRGAVPRSPARTVNSLVPLATLASPPRILTAAGPMGEEEARSAGLACQVVYSPSAQDSCAADTVAAAVRMVEMGAGLIVFAGGDGTARDICRAVGETVPALGIPAGVKIHSPVFAQTPVRAGELLRRLCSGNPARFQQSEVLDIDEDCYRSGRVSTRLYGYLRVPAENGTMQGRKAGTPVSERAQQNAIALDLIDAMQGGVTYLIGPGSTTMPIMTNLGLEGSLLGIDLVRDGQLIASDATEQQIITAVAGRLFKIIVTPIGGQGYLFGRGNHQLSPAIIQAAGKENILVAATMEKLGRLQGAPLLVDTGDQCLDVNLAGYIRVTTGYRQQIIYPLR